MHVCVSMHVLLCRVYQLESLVSVHPDTTLATRMVHGVLREFDLSKQSIEDFCERFKVYCLANNICGKEEAAVNWKKALFLTLLSQTAFVKLKTLASPRPVGKLILD